MVEDIRRPLESLSRNRALVLWGKRIACSLWAIVDLPLGGLTPMVLAYIQRQWPHDRQCFTASCAANLDVSTGIMAPSIAIRESSAKHIPIGTRDIHESYIDGGHPYWAMQAFALWLIPREEPFWTASGGTAAGPEPSFRRKLETPGHGCVQAINHRAR